MKAYRVTVVYGKNERWIDERWIAENAIEKFKEEKENAIRNILGWKKAINYRIHQNCYYEINENGNGTIHAYTIDGYKTIKVN